MKAAIYCRVSTEEQDATKQERSCTEYCKRNNIDVYDIYRDEGISGMKTSRPEFDRLLKDMRQYKFDTIMVSINPEFL